MRLMDSPQDFTGPVNLGNPGEFTIRELAEMIIQLTDSPSKLAFEPLPIDDPKQRQPDIGLAKAQLAWTPTVALREGLRETVAYFDQLLAQSPRQTISSATGSELAATLRATRA
jgi:UDP-glucuronate decarboxylase